MRRASHPYRGGIREQFNVEEFYKLIILLEWKDEMKMVIRVETRHTHAMWQRKESAPYPRPHLERGRMAPTPLFWSPKTIHPFYPLGTFSLSHRNVGITLFVFMYLQVYRGVKKGLFVLLSRT